MSERGQAAGDPMAQVRHDLRTPVNHILGFSEMLQEDVEANGHLAYVEDLKKIQFAARQLNDLIQQRLSAGRTDFLSAEVDASLAAASSAPANSAMRSSGGVDPVGPPLAGHALAVDDDAKNREVLVKRLERQGLTVDSAAGGIEALERVRAHAYDVVLLDLMMPDMDGSTVLRLMKADEQLRHIPVIMISALDEMDSVIRCIEAGAEDYLSKPFNPTLLRARLAACLDKKAMRDAEQEHLKTIQQTQVRLSKELSEAAHYVRSLFPEPAQEPLRVDWKYQPSGELGGDAFGYHWIDDQHFAIYLLDVCGHGVGAALLSAAAINVIRMGSLPNTDFRDPSSVLFSLNNTFMMEKQNNMFFTIWYGVFHVPSRKLSHAAGGHPPALLLSQDASGGKQLQQVLSPGLLIGAVGDMTYDAETITVPEDARLLVFSDGCYEIQKSDGHVMTFAEYEEFMATHGWQDRGLDELLEWCYQRHGPGALEDDFSILRVRF